MVEGQISGGRNLNNSIFSTQPQLSQKLGIGPRFGSWQNKLYSNNNDNALTLEGKVRENNVPSMIAGSQLLVGILMLIRLSSVIIWSSVLDVVKRIFGNSFDDRLPETKIKRKK